MRATGIMTLKNLSLKNKIFLATTAVILLISVFIALFTRWVLISSLTSELKRRGLGIANSIAESGRGHILTADIPALTSLLFDARLHERRQLILYVFVLDQQQSVIAHTFIDDFPAGLDAANPIAEGSDRSIRLLRLRGHSVYDIAVPVKEGIYEIATVRLGLNKRHIDHLIGKLRTTFLGFVSVVTIIFFIVSHWLSRYITRPLSELTEISDELSRGNFEIRPTPLDPARCWERMNCGQRACPAFGNDKQPCWKLREAAGEAEDTLSGWSRSEVQCSDCEMFGESGGDEVRQLTKSFVNMTHRIKRSQIQLKESEEKYRSLFTSGPNPIFVVDRSTLNILDANSSAEETYRYPRDDLIGMRFTELGPLDFQQISDLRSVRTATQLLTAKMQFFRSDRSPLYVNVHASPTRYQERDAWIVATADISEMVEKDSQLIQASKMTTLGEMSAGIAHELNQPLNAIKMGSEYLQMMVETDRDISPSHLVEVVNEMSGQVDRAAQIIVRLRDFGRKADFTREKVNLNHAVGSVLDIVGKQLNLQNIDVRSELDETIPPILAHHNRLEQVIFNLITNARDAINQRPENSREPGQRQIRIRSFTENGTVAVSVSDTGIGIPEGHKDQIFEAFFTTKQMGEGMGLGLAITTGIVGDYGGTIDVESRDGEGATFTLKFPAAI